jgi:hypothetical protein
MIGLCSKTYIIKDTKAKVTSSLEITATKLLRKAKFFPRKRLIVRKKKVTELKFSSKGISKKRVRAPMTTFRHVLRTHISAVGSLKGYRTRHNQIFSYEQTRNGFPYFYCKRKVLADGINTVPLDINSVR